MGIAEANRLKFEGEDLVQQGRLVEAKQKFEQALQEIAGNNSKTAKRIRKVLQAYLRRL